MIGKSLVQILRHITQDVIALAHRHKCTTYTIIVHINLCVDFNFYGSPESVLDETRFYFYFFSFHSLHLLRIYFLFLPGHRWRPIRARLFNIHHLFSLHRATTIDEKWTHSEYFITAFPLHTNKYWFSKVHKRKRCCFLSVFSTTDVATTTRMGSFFLNLSTRSDESIMDSQLANASKVADAEPMMKMCRYEEFNDEIKIEFFGYCLS